RRRKRGTHKMAVYTYPSKKALASITAKVRALTNRARHRTLADLLRQLNAALRGWCNYFRHGVSAATFRYLGQLAWRRVTQWLRKRHPGITWKQLRRRYLAGQPGWRPAENGIKLFYPQQVEITATAGERPTSQHPGRAWRRHSPPHSNKGTRGAPVAWRRARRVRRADRGNGPGEIPEPRPGPTQLPGQDLA
ncbi:MAG TPA: group II intron maturase-specific domain-containing protein, partial [Acidimicrobiales bacterium]|nr:group II intron maturase-specific domain-containing protein [Acidimicrobiales bacterium]